MFKCEVCGCEEARTELVSDIFLVEGKRILVEQIPARVCTVCGERTFSRDTTEKVRRIAHGEAAPVGVVELEIYAFA